MIFDIPLSAPELHRGQPLLSIYWVQFSVARMFVFLRFYARFSIHAIGLDDWAIAIAVVLRYLRSILSHREITNCG